MVQPVCHAPWRRYAPRGARACRSRPGAAHRAPDPRAWLPAARARQSGLCPARSADLASRSMKQRRLGRTGLVVSEICLGTMTFGSMADEAASHRILDLAFDARRRLPRHRRDLPGAARPEVGRPQRGDRRQVARRPRRATRVFVATKIAGPRGGWFPAPRAPRQDAALDRHHDRARGRGEPAAPRHRLHRPLPDALARPELPIEETLEALDRARRGGQGPRTSAAATRPPTASRESLWTADAARHGRATRRSRTTSAC